MENAQFVQSENGYISAQDPREALFRYAVDSKWVITEMSPHSANLESIFRNLTTEETANA